MAIVPGCEYDIFVSYAHTDNSDPEGGEGWVSQFVRHFEIALRRRFGANADALEIFFDNRVTSANSQLQELLLAAGSSALFLAVGSPSYATRDWPRQELGDFIRNVADPSRLFMIECLPLNEGEVYPAPLDSHIHPHFWTPSGSRRVPMSYSPTCAEFDLLVNSLAADIRNKLSRLRFLPLPTVKAGPRSEQSIDASPNLGEAEALGGPRKVILIAQATDDVEDEADQLRRYLGQYEEDVLVLPRACYPQGGDEFSKAFANDLAGAGLFVQVLGQRTGRVPPDLPDGYTRHQLGAAKALGTEIMQWRHPDLDVGMVADRGYAAVLSSETVVACGLEAFKRQILAWVHKPEPKPRESHSHSSTVFINADSKDLSVAREIGLECSRHALITILPAAGPSSSKVSRRDLTENLTACDVLLFIYGDTTQDWIRRQLLFFNKVRPKREAELKLLAICSGPPTEKPDIDIYLPNVHLISCPDAWSIEPIWKLISETIES